MTDTDIVHQKPDGKWYFWDETGCDEYGPYGTREEADHECERYAKEVLGL